MRARPGEDFLQTLDAKAARGFARPRGAGARGRAGVGGMRMLLLRPTSGLALAVLIAAAVAVPVLVSSGAHKSRRAVPILRGPVEAVSAPNAAAPPSVTDKAQLRSPAPATVGASTQSAASAQSTAGAPSAASSSPLAGGAARLIERTATLDVGVAPASLQSSAQRVFTLVSTFGGYVRSSSVSTDEPKRGEEPAIGEEAQRGGASFDIRVPSVHLSEAIAALAHLGHVRSENNTTNDATDQHTSLRRAFDAAQAERSAILTKLRRAFGEAEIEALKVRLHAVDARIASLEAQLRALDQRVTYTSLALSLTPDTSAGGASSGDLTPGGAAHDAAQILDAALAVLLIAAAAMLPAAVVLVAVWAAIVLTRRRLREHALDAS
jgi:hypothetical protein